MPPLNNPFSQGGYKSQPLSKQDQLYVMQQLMGQVSTPQPYTASNAKSKKVSLKRVETRPEKLAPNILGMLLAALLPDVELTPDDIERIVVDRSGITIHTADTEIRFESDSR